MSCNRTESTREIMKRKLLMALAILSLSATKKNLAEPHHHNNDVLPEDEDYIKKKPVQYGRMNTDLPSKQELAIEKIVDTVLSGEQYFKKVDNIQTKLIHLNYLVHNQTGTIIKYLLEMLRLVQTAPTSIVENQIREMRNDIGKINTLLTKHNRLIDPSRRVDGGAEYRLESNLDSRLKVIEEHMKSITTSVDSISGIISQVKHRQNAHKTLHKPEVGSALDSLTLISEFRKALHEQKPRKCECKIGRMERNERYPTDCHEIQIQGFNISGIYKIKPEDIDPFYVLCDLSTAGGGWTVFQNRFDGSQDFYKTWSEYKYGFGNLAGEFWLGLEQLHHLTNQKLYELRVELETQHGRDGFAGYSVFTVASEHEGYRIGTLGSFQGTAGDSLTYHAGQKFSTHDSDNDEWKDGSCATEHGGAWWYKECDKSNLNGKYTVSADEPQGQNMYWISFKAPAVPLTKSRMMIRPLPASRPIDYNQHPRKILDGSKLRVEEQPKVFRGKPGYETAQPRKPYRYEGHSRDEVFFPNYT